MDYNKHVNLITYKLETWFFRSYKSSPFIWYEWKLQKMCKPNRKRVFIWVHILKGSKIRRRVIVVQIKVEMALYTIE